MAIGGPDYGIRTITSGGTHQQVKVSVTSADSTGTFTTQMAAVLIRNEGPNTLYFELDDTADTDKMSLYPREGIVVNKPVTVVHLICAIGNTATAKLFGVA